MGRGLAGIKGVGALEGFRNALVWELCGEECG